MNKDLKITLDSASWVYAQTLLLMKKYKKCKTERARKKLLPKLKSIRGKMNFEKQILNRVIDGSYEV